MLKKNWIWLFIGVVILFVWLEQCQQEPKVITKTEVVYKDRVDTITKTTIDTAYITRYVRKTITEKGKDSLIYVTRPDSTTVQAREYRTTLEADSASADLKILTTGELLDVQGTISWKEKQTTTTITKTKAKSGLFLYGESSIVPVGQRIELGLDYQIRNTIIIGSSISYDLQTQKPSVNVKLGIRIF